MRGPFRQFRCICGGTKLCWFDETKWSDTGVWACVACGHDWDDATELRGNRLVTNGQHIYVTGKPDEALLVLHANRLSISVRDPNGRRYRIRHEDVGGYHATENVYV